MTTYVVNLLTGTDKASIPEALAVAGFTIAVVFGVLLLICIAIKIFSAIIGGIEKSVVKETAPAAAPAAKPSAVEEKPAAPEEEFSSGSLKLKGCDEKTAAMIMAIVSDNTGIPLSELVFKSITLVENK